MDENPIISCLAITALCFFLAKRDGTTYLMHGKPRNFIDRLKWWHVEGAIIYGIGCFPFIHSWWMLAIVLLVRFGLYDIIYNRYANIPVGYIGFEAFTDKITRKIFKTAVNKAIAAAIILIILIWIRAAK